MTTMSKDLDLAMIRIDGGTQPRVSINQDVVAEHKAGYELGERRPHLDVFYDGADYWLADGFHRFHGALAAKLETHPCNIHRGTQRDAVLFSVGANSKHGLRRTNEDKRKAVAILLADAEWSQMSQRWIAEKCGVSPNFVSEQIAQLSSDDSCNHKPGKIGKDGRKRSGPKKPRKPRPKKAKKPKAKTGKPSAGTTFDPSEFDSEAESTAEATLVVDIPAHLTEVLAGVKEYKSLQWEVSRLYGKVDALAKLPIGSYIQLQEIQIHIDQVKADLKAYSFGDNCPLCKNKPSEKCERCKGRGWLAHSQMVRLSDFDKQWLETNSVKP